MHVIEVDIKCKAISGTTLKKLALRARVVTDRPLITLADNAATKYRNARENFYNWSR